MELVATLCDHFLSIYVMFCVLCSALCCFMCFFLCFRGSMELDATPCAIVAMVGHVMQQRDAVSAHLVSVVTNVKTDVHLVSELRTNTYSYWRLKWVHM